MKCYYFYQQRKNHLEMTKAQGDKRVPFTTGFLKDRILNCWQQHKTRI